LANPLKGFWDQIELQQLLSPWDRWENWKSESNSRRYVKNLCIGVL